MSHSSAVAAADTAEIHRARRKTLVGTGVGNAMEWYDWNVYASFAAIFSTQIFNPDDPSAAFLSTMAVFAVGFIARPFGGAVFGWIADRVGRKHSLTLVVACASIGSLMIALCPTYARAGLLAPIILVVARLLQGLAHGGELPSAQTYLAEEAPAEKRGLWSSSIYISGTLGILTGMALGLLLNTVLTEEQMAHFGWRIPFVLGAIFGVFAYWMRTQMEESEVFEADVKKDETPKQNVFVALFTNWKLSLQVIFMTAGLTVSYYVWSVAMVSLAQSTFGYSAQDAFIASIIGTIALVLCLAPWGWISDHWGRKPNMYITFVGCAALTFPLTHFAQQGEVWKLTVSIVIMLILLGAVCAIAPAIYAEMFPTGNRASGMGVPYALAVAGFGGTAPLVMAQLADRPGAFQWYAIIMLGLSALVTFTLKETKGVSLKDDLRLDEIHGEVEANN